MRSAFEYDVFLSPALQSDDGDHKYGAAISPSDIAATKIEVVSMWHCDIHEREC